VRRVPPGDGEQARQDDGCPECGDGRETAQKWGKSCCTAHGHARSVGVANSALAILPINIGSSHILL